jgi:hypothetical protein
MFNISGVDYPENIQISTCTSFLVLNITHELELSFSGRITSN